MPIQGLLIFTDQVLQCRMAGFRRFKATKYETIFQLQEILHTFDVKLNLKFNFLNKSMVLFQKIRQYEHLHIVFWLIKDSCWMLEWRWAGALVMLPTLYLAIYIMLKTFGSIDFYINAAIFFWILANSYWMMMEFFNDNELKHYALFPFSMGFIFVGLFFIRSKRAENRPE